MDVDDLSIAFGPLIRSVKENMQAPENIPMDTGTLEALGEGGKSSSPSEIFDVPSSYDSISMEEEVIDASVLLSSDICNRAQFWGAVSIFVEKPHILNRRLCGVADLWWGKLSLHKTEKLGFQAAVSVAADHNIPKSQATDDKPVIQDGFSLENRSANSNLREEQERSKCSVAKTHEDATQISFDFTTLNNLDKLMWQAWKLLQCSVGQSEALCNENDPQRIDTQNSDSNKLNSNGRTLFNEEKLLDDLKNLLRNSAFEDIPVIEGRRFEPWPELTGGSEAVFAVVRRALPKQIQRFSTPLELLLLDGRRGRCSVTCSPSKPTLLPFRPYHLQHQLESSRLAMLCYRSNCSKNSPIYGSVAPPTNDVTTLTENEKSPANSTLLPAFSSGVQWLQDVVLPRVAKWATQISESGATGNNGSLTNVDLQDYSALYSSLKSKYAEKLVKSWTERTDPHKFVHEDIGIATYLLLLWAKLPRPQRFLDLGCGNGLLVYILASEGHKGQGLDIRKRAIWDTFPAFVDLKEQVVRPHDGCLPSEADWLLGNHSDELTPWIPVMAARAPNTCNFFVLPCCPHDFTAKFLRRNSSMSQYSDYLDYVQEVGEQCGFVMERDRLKIPSTKRVCFVGRTRTYAIEDRPAVLQRLQQFIDKRVAHYINNQPARKEQEEPAQDCTREGSQRDESASDGTSGVAGSQTHAGVGVFSNAGFSSLATPQTIPNGGNRDSLTNEITEKSVTLELLTNGVYSSEAQSLGGGKLWSSGFVARGREQRTRNCTQLHQDVKDDLVGAVVRVVLGTEPLQACSSWQAGSSTPLRQVAEALGPRRLQQLKKECGGLQTLLRNHRHIFAVQKGTVTLRAPGTLPEDLKRHRPCWFFLHHPQGCPNSSHTCIYVHTPLGEAAGSAVLNAATAVHA